MRVLEDLDGAKLPEFADTLDSVPEIWRDCYRRDGSRWFIPPGVFDALGDELAKAKADLAAAREESERQIAELDGKIEKHTALIENRKFDDALAAALAGIVAPKLITSVVKMLRSDLALSFDPDGRLTVQCAGGAVAIEHWISRWRESDEALAFSERKREEATFFTDKLRRAMTETIH